VATWAELSEESQRAAVELLRVGAVRSSLSRYYYSAYSRLADALTQAGVCFPTGWEGPSHASAGALAEDRLTSLSREKRKVVRALLKQLYAWRLAADYHPSEDVPKRMAHDAHTSVEVLRRIL
jgi:hypothetical protein